MDQRNSGRLKSRRVLEAYDDVALQWGHLGENNRNKTTCCSSWIIWATVQNDYFSLDCVRDQESRTTSTFRRRRSIKFKWRGLSKTHSKRKWGILADLVWQSSLINASQRRTSRRLAVSRLAEGRPSPVLKLPTFGLQNAINKPPNVTLTCSHNSIIENMTRLLQKF